MTVHTPVLCACVRAATHEASAESSASWRRARGMNGNANKVTRAGRHASDAFPSGEGASVSFPFGEGDSAGISFGEPRETRFQQIHPRETRFQQTLPRQTHFQQADPRQTHFQQTGPRETHFQQVDPRQTRFQQIADLAPWRFREKRPNKAFVAATAAAHTKPTVAERRPGLLFPFRRGRDFRCLRM